MTVYIDPKTGRPRVLHEDAGVVIVREGPPGPTGVSTDPHNQATIGSDGLIHVQQDMIVVQDLGDVPPDTPTNTVVVHPQ